MPDPEPLQKDSHTLQLLAIGLLLLDEYLLCESDSSLNLSVDPHNQLCIPQLGFLLRHLSLIYSPSECHPVCEAQIDKVHSWIATFGHNLADAVIAAASGCDMPRQLAGYALGLALPRNSIGFQHCFLPSLSLCSDSRLLS